MLSLLIVWVYVTCTLFVLIMFSCGDVGVLFVSFILVVLILGLYVYFYLLGIIWVVFVSCVCLLDVFVVLGCLVVFVSVVCVGFV